MVFLRKRRRRERLPQKFWTRRSFIPGKDQPPLTRAGLIARVGIVVGFVFLLVLICFYGRSMPRPQVALNQPAKVRIMAEVDFSYVSEILTERRRQQRREEISPVYRVDPTPLASFERMINRINADYVSEASEGRWEELAGEEKFDAVREFVRESVAGENLQPDADALTRLLLETSEVQRSRYFRIGLDTLRRIHENGIVSAEDPNFQAAVGYQSVRIFIEDEGLTQFQVWRPAEARNELRNAVANSRIADEHSEVLFQVFSVALRENLIFDREATRTRREEAAREVDPVVVSVQEGETIIEPGVTVGTRDLEKLQQHRQILDQLARDQFLIEPFLRERIYLTLIIVGMSLLIARMLYPKSMEKPTRMVLLGLVVLLNLVLIRFLLEIGEAGLVAEDSDFLAALPYGAPFMIAAVSVTILLGAIPGTLSALLVTLLYGLMVGNTMEVFLAAFSASLVGIYFCRDVRLRTNVIKATILTGATFALLTVIYGLMDGASLAILARQVAGALIAGFLSGVVVLGLLPFLENTFKFTTDITLLEYTDFNHPLLRRMQIEAPGSYHHSLMVANLSENAAAAIGANPLICRACSLFHDIGKLVKPDYFTENQREGHNPLLETNPSMSALIIKSHVKEGVELAHKYRLPRIFVDVIREHHGTTLIKYFYFEALNRSKKDHNLPLFPELARVQSESVDESTYRYDGPRPSFIESAIIFFADSVEAASRSLKKVNSQSVDELLDAIFQSRIDDRQLDLCPLTLEQIAVIKRVFSRTILNSMHARIAYPGESEPAEETKASGEKESTSTATA